jgi:hypothetical protein
MSAVHVGALVTAKADERLAAQSNALVASQVAGRLIAQGMVAQADALLAVHVDIRLAVQEDV